MRRLSLPIDLFVLLFAISAFLGIAPAYDRTASYTLLIVILVSVLLYFVIAHWGLSWKGGRTLGMVLVLAGSGFALMFILQYRYQNYQDGPRFIQQLGQATTFLPNLGIIPPYDNAAVSTFLEGILPLGFAAILSRQRKRFRIVSVACSLIIIYALLLTFSRGAFVGLIVALLIACTARSWRLGLLVTACIVVVSIAVFAIINTSNMLITDNSFAWVTNRYELYRNSLYVAGDYAFTGIGLGSTFAMVYSRYGLLIQVLFLGYTHNLPLAIWMGQGLLGLVAFAGLVITFYLFVYRVIQSALPRQLFHGAWLGVTATLIHGLFDARQYVESAWLMPVLFILIGLTVATGRLALKQAAQEDRYINLSYVPRYIPVIALAGIMVFVLIFNRQLVAAWNTNLGALDETRGELIPNMTTARQAAYYESAQHYYRLALANDPNWPNANRRLGNLNVKMEQFAEAIAPLETAAAEEPANPAAVKGLGLAYVWVGRTEDAARTLQRLKDPRAMAEELGVWGFYRGDQQKYLLSAYAYETAQLMFPDIVNINGWLNLGETFRRADDLDRARWWYEQVLVAEPGNETARNALDEIESST